MRKRRRISASVAALFLRCTTAILIGWAGASPAQTPTTVPSSSQATQPATEANQLSHLTLQRATDLLIANNLAVIAARFNVDILRAQRIAAGLKPRPTLTFSATQFALPEVFRNPRNLIHSNTLSAANTTYLVEVDQLFERGNKRDLRILQAEVNTQAAEAQVKDALRQQLFQLRQVFLTAVLARDNLRVAGENLNHFNQTERILFAQVKEGYTAGVDLKRVQLQQLQFQSDVTSAEQSYEQSLRDVLNLIGKGDAPSLANTTQLTGAVATPSTLPGLDGSLEAVDGSLEVIPTLLWIDDLRRMALANRPDIRAAELTFEAAQKGVELAEAQRVRDVTVGTQYSRTGGDNTLGVVLSAPLSTRRFANSATAQATAAKLQAGAQLRLTRTQALTDVEKAFIAYSVSRERLRLFTAGALSTAADVQRIEEIAYRDGAKGLLDYLDAQRTYNQTQLAYNQARFDFLLSLYQLEFATSTTIVK